MDRLQMLCGIVFLLMRVLAVLPEAVAEEVQPPLARVTTILNRAVQDPEGKDVGRIEEVLFDTVTGDVPYAVLGAGGFLGLGTKLWTVPWHILHQHQAKTLRVAISEEQLKNAPSFGRDDWPDMEARHWDDAIHAYYGQPTGLGKQLPPKSGEPPPPAAPHRLWRTSYVLTSEVVNPRGQRLGKVHDVVLDVTTGKVVYAVLAHNEGVLGLQDKLFAIPWLALQQSPGLGTLTLDVNASALREAPGFDREHWPSAAESRWEAGQSR